MLKLTSYIFSFFILAQSAQAEVIDNPYKRTCSGLTSKKMQEYMDKKRPMHLHKYRQAQEAKKSVEKQDEFVNDTKNIKKDICSSEKIQQAISSLKTLQNAKPPEGRLGCADYEQQYKNQANAIAKIKIAQAFFLAKKGDINSNKNPKDSFTSLSQKRHSESLEAINQARGDLDKSNQDNLNKEADDIFSKKSNKNKKDESVFLSWYNEMDQDFHETEQKMADLNNYQAAVKQNAAANGLACKFVDIPQIGPQ